MILNSGDFFAEQSLLVPRAFMVEGIGIELMVLTDSLIQAVQEEESAEKMIMLAADSGLAYYVNGESFRVVDNERLTKQIDAWWAKDELLVDADPSIKYQVGLLVCDISGISEFINDKLEYEKLEKEESDKREAEAKAHLLAEQGKPIDGDNLGDTSMSLKKLHEDKEAA